MKLADKYLTTFTTNPLYHIDLHRFMELVVQSTHIEIAEELGISLREVNMLKRKIVRL